VPATIIIDQLQRRSALRHEIGNVTLVTDLLGRNSRIEALPNVEAVPSPYH
jgi:hypothetical protein